MRLTQLTPLALICALLAVPAAASAVPATLVVEGVLTSAGGTPSADGTYDVTFSLFADKTAATALWAEGPVKIAVAGGRFSHALGSVKALDAKVLAAGNRWIGIQVASDKLPRQPLHSVAYALVAAQATSLSCSGCVAGNQLAAGSIAAAKVGFTYAGSTTKGGPASDVACTACVSVKELKFDGDVDLGGNSLKAKNGTFSGGLSAASVTAKAFVGDGSKLTGIKHAVGDCKTGMAVVGIAADGTLKCAPAGANGNNALDGMISTEFTEIADVTALPVAIPDNQGTVAVATATFGKVGKANAIKVHIEVTNTDLSNVLVTLLPPDDKAKGMTVCDPCGKKDEKLLKLDLTEKSTLKSGSLASYIGKAVDGTWNLKVLDSSFCVPQAPNNAALCDTTKKTDGLLKAFTVHADVTSSVSVGTPGSIKVGHLNAAPFACKSYKAGHIYFNTKVSRLAYCDGVQWRYVDGRCGNGMVEKGEACDDGNHDETDGCTSLCAVKAETSCKVILTKNKAAKSGWYTIDQDGSGVRAAQRVFCDMTMDGGGWTRFIHHVDPDGMTGISMDSWNRGISFAASGGIKQWMVKTYFEPNQDTEKASKFVNAWVLNLAASHDERGFTFFRHSTNLSYNSHRYTGTSYVSSTKLLPGSECKTWHGSYGSGRYLWGEHRWSANNSVGWMWMSHCASPRSGHLLIVNHDYYYPAGRNQTMVLSAKNTGGTHNSYDENGAAFEFFYRE